MAEMQSLRPLCAVVEGGDRRFMRRRKVGSTIVGGGVGGLSGGEVEEGLGNWRIWGWFSWPSLVSM